MNDMTIHIAGTADSASCIQVLTRAFAGDPPTRWVWSDPEQYREVFPRFVHAFAGSAFQGRTAHHAGAAGVALWLGPGAASDGDALGALLEETVPAERRDEVFSVFGQMDDYHPHDPTWYLPLIGVAPAHQSRGVGSALLRHALQQCDREGLPAYLEATTPGSLRLYSRHGFEPLGAIPCPGAGEIVPMLRRPR